MGWGRGQRAHEPFSVPLELKTLALYGCCAKAQSGSLAYVLQCKYKALSLGWRLFCSLGGAEERASAGPRGTAGGGIRVLDFGGVSAPRVHRVRTTSGI